MEISLHNARKFPDYLPNTYLTYYLLAKETVEKSNIDRTRANEVMESREKDLFEGVEHYLKTGENITKGILCRVTRRLDK